MEDHTLNIDLALKIHNAARDKEKHPKKVTMSDIAIKVFPELSKSAATSKLSALNQGQHERVGKLTIKNIRDIAKHLDVPVALLFNVPKSNQ